MSMEMVMMAACVALAACCVFMATRMRRDAESGARPDEESLRAGYEARLDRVEAEIKDGFERHRRSAGEAESAARQEMGGLFRGFREDVEKRLADQGECLRSGLASMQDSVGKGMDRHRQSLQDGIGKVQDGVVGTVSTLMKTVDQRLAEQQKASQEGARHVQDGVVGSVSAMMRTMDQRLAEQQKAMQEGIGHVRDGVVGSVSAMMRTMDQRLAEQQKAMQEGIGHVRDGVVGNVTALMKTVDQRLAEQQKAMQEGIGHVRDGVVDNIAALMKTVDQRLAEQDRSVKDGLRDMLEANERKLEQMRSTVDEKLQSTLEARLTGAFGQVSRQLESVEQGLGAMQTLAGDVGGLKRALSNVKVAGTMGEYQLEALLGQILHPGQYEANVHPNPGNPRCVVEFAIRLPGGDEGSSVWLPIDSKFPTANYERLLDAYQAGDVGGMEASRKELVKDIKRCAGDIGGKYVEVPYTTPFAMMFLPFEGLYAEVIRIPGLFAEVQRAFQVTIVGPTTLGAFLSSLQMGFRTLAVQRKTKETIQLLGAVRTQFGKFGEMLDKAHKQIETAEKTIGDLRHRNGIISRRIQGIEELPMDEAQRILPLGRTAAGGDAEEEM